MSTTDLARAVCFLCILAGSTVLSQDATFKKCLGESDRDRTLNVTLSCGPGTVIEVGQAYFGQHDWGLCFFVEDTCTEDIKSVKSCNQESNCTRIFNGTYTPKCGYSTFLIVEYNCKPGATPTPAPAPTSTPAPPTWADPNLHTRAPTTRVPAYVGSLDPVVTPKSRDDTALIAGCAIAVVVTMTTLIIAIILVVRRLFCLPHNGGNQSPKKSRISMFICSKLGCVLARCRNPDPEEASQPQIQVPDLEEEGRVTPLGADAVEIVQELGQPDMTSDSSSTNQTDPRTHLVTNVPAEVNSSAPRDVVNRPDGSPVPDSPRNSQQRMDAVALPNTELSTLC